MADKLDTLIFETRAECDSLRQQIDVLERQLAERSAKLEAYEEAAALRPGVAKRVRPNGTARRGRQPGALSEEWKTTLREIYRRSVGGLQPLTYAEIFDIVTRDGKDVQMNSVRDRVRRFIEAGIMKREDEDGFVVTDEAARKYGFEKEGGPATAEPLSNLGPVGRERGYPPSAPEGSTPSGSTAPQSPSAGGYSRDLDDEIPF